MDALKSAFRRPGLSLVLASFVLLMPSGLCFAGHGHFIDPTTRCRWSRTWHGPNSIWRPLTRYYVPRPADPCLYGGYGRSGNEEGGFADSCDIAIEGDGRYLGEGAVEYESGDLAGCGELRAIPIGLERLGQIPNDLGISAGAPKPEPARTSR